MTAEIHLCSAVVESIEFLSASDVLLLTGGGEEKKNLYPCHNVFRHFKVREKFNFLLLV